ncbi:TPA: hypothetical protein I7745_16875 [Vibrio vulnificus]|uniref:hypothetical protein n=1 Tax=Vibrio brasiliensis TaxID=170652 RepID=UPI001A208DDD|nr:hypothetical protein [Vibrio brasiliensis]MCG9726809.1 hypothetical protein [Vibrio brasiliensis]HAS8532587.1 hypothetical protein [Vibrio vulnificus]
MWLELVRHAAAISVLIFLISGTLGVTFISHYKKGEKGLFKYFDNFLLLFSGSSELDEKGKLLQRIFKLSFVFSGLSMSICFIILTQYLY